MDTNSNPIQLGKLIKKRRAELGLSTRKLGETSGVTHSFIAKLEAGRFRTVAAHNLQGLARALDLPPEDLFALAGYRVPEGLPTFNPYLRARYGEELPERAMQTLNETFEALRSKYAGSDEVDDEIVGITTGPRGRS